MWTNPVSGARTCQPSVSQRLHDLPFQEGLDAGGRLGDRADEPAGGLGIGVGVEQDVSDRLGRHPDPDAQPHGASTGFGARRDTVHPSTRERASSHIRTPLRVMIEIRIRMVHTRGDGH
ncbi:hypothetical protein ACFWSF_20350 [Streptomyces sp. NPDC058611]|uniref:hypothetical protein n=1 Tax=unclassified Streptomyces TaxID=2593676 RepID=UPI0036671667